MNNNRYKDPYDYEIETAKKIPGGKRSIASGAFFGNMDVQSSDCVIDCKRVEKGKSYRITLKDFKGVEKVAGPDQIPMMFINFNEEGKSLAVIREEDAIGFIEGMNNDS